MCHIFCIPVCSDWLIYACMLRRVLDAACGIFSCDMHAGSSSPTRDWTWAPCIGSVESYPLDHQGSPSPSLFWRPRGNVSEHPSRFKLNGTKVSSAQGGHKFWNQTSPDYVVYGGLFFLEGSFPAAWVTWSWLSKLLLLMPLTVSSTDQFTVPWSFQFSCSGEAAASGSNLTFLLFSTWSSFLAY